MKLGSDLSNCFPVSSSAYGSGAGAVKATLKNPLAGIPLPCAGSGGGGGNLRGILHLQQEQEVIPDTEDPKLLSNLKFMSPKTGVYRPQPRSSRAKHNCVVS
jgi:hypothetical protein